MDSEVAREGVGETPSVELDNDSAVSDGDASGNVSDTSEKVLEETILEVEVLEVEPGEDVRLRVARAKEIVRRRSNWAMAGGIIPIPVFDLITVAGIQLAMVRELSIYYHVPFHRNLVKSFVMTLLGSVVPFVAGAGLAGSIAKAVPFLSWSVGLATVSVVAGATTHATGSAFIQHFESGGTLLNFDPIATREYFRREFEEARRRAGRGSSAGSV